MLAKAERSLANATLLALLALFVFGTLFVVFLVIVLDVRSMDKCAKLYHAELTNLTEKAELNLIELRLLEAELAHHRGDQVFSAKQLYADWHQKFRGVVDSTKPVVVELDSTEREWYRKHCSEI